MRASTQPFKPYVEAAAAPSKSDTDEAYARQNGTLTTFEIDRFGSEGFLALPGFCDADGVHAIREILLPLFQRRVGHEEGRQFDMLGLDIEPKAMRQPQILNPSAFAPTLLQTEHFRKVRQVAQLLLGPYAQFSFDHSILKPARSRAATPWHQDEAHHEHKFFRYRQISFWMPLQDTPLESGCMRYIPRSHMGPVLPHRNLNDDPRIHAMECIPQYFNESDAIARPAFAGTCILHDGRTLHGALPNISGEERLAYVIAFVGPPEPVDPRVAKNSQSKRLAFVAANEKRRHSWLLHGGFLRVLSRRLRQGIRSHPKILLLKLHLLLKGRPRA